MILTGLRLVDFRNFKRGDLRFSPGLNLIRGENGQGKTNLLEAIGLLATGRSFRRAPPAAMRRHDRPEFFLSGHSRAGGLQHRLGFHGQPHRLTAHLNGKPMSTVSALGRVLSAVILTPDLPSLIKGGPGERRDYLDWLAFSNDRSHAPRVRNYQVALKARNRLLKTGRGTPREMSAWEARLATIGAEITRARRLVVASLDERLPAPLAALDLDPDRFSWGLSCQLDRFERKTGGESGKNGAITDIDRYRLLYEKHRANDRQQGTTGIGPHRDDLLLHLSGRPLSRYASRGQQKRFLLALKLAEAQRLEETLGEPPLLLLDDPFTELDADGIQRLLTLLAARKRQLFLATCDDLEIDWPAPAGKTVFTVIDGKIHGDGEEGGGGG